MVDHPDCGNAVIAGGADIFYPELGGRAVHLHALLINTIPMPLLSVIIPVYNEESTLEKVINIINAVDIDKEIIVVNDASTDRTRQILENLKLPNLRLFSHSKNQGKGAAFRTGLKQAKGEVIIIQDADLEYDPNDYLKLVPPIINNQADMVLGARFTKGYMGLRAHQWGNQVLTALHNFLFGDSLNDLYTCYKAARKEVFQDMELKSDGFSIEQEIMAKAARKKLRIIEVPIEYHPRSYAEGKKIRYHDAFKVILRMIRIRFFE